MAAAVLAADCSTSGGGLVAASTDAGESGAPTDAGSGGGNGQGDGRGSDAGGSRAAYHVIDLGTKALDRGGVMDMSRNGLVLAASGGVRWVYDTSTGATRDVPPTVSVINSSGVTAGVRPAGKKDASGLCDDSEVFLHYPDGTEKGLGNPVNGDYGGLRCEAAQGCIVGDECRLLSALDDAGDLVAQWDSLENGVHSTNVYVWDGTSWRKLPRLGGESDSADSAAHGEVVGRSSTKRAADLSQTQHAVMWRGDVATDLGTLGGGYSAAHGINERGQVVGQSNYAGRVSSHAFLWDSGRMTDLGSLPGFDTTVAASINLHGQVVGTASYYSWAGPSATRAIIFAGGQAYDLNDLVDTHDLPLVTGRRIADNGAIAVSTGGPSYHPVVLVPTGAPLAPDRSWRSAGTVMASGELAANLALDATNVYWITVSADRDLSIKAAPKVGGAVTTLWSTHAGFTYGNLLVDDRYVWFDMMVCAGAVCTGTTPGIWRVPKTGGSPERFAEGSEWLALNDRKVYSTRPVPSYPTQELISTPKAGGATVVHATGEFASYLAVDGDVAYFVKRVQTGNWSLSVLCSESSGRVTELTAPSIDFSGGEIQLDATSIYLRDGYHLLRFPRSGGAPRVLATITPSSPPSGHDLEVNGGFVYWTQDAHDGQPACVTRIDANGGNAVCLDRGFWRYPAVRVDDTSVFLIRDTDIVRLAK